MLLSELPGIIALDFTMFQIYNVYKCLPELPVNKGWALWITRDLCISVIRF